MKLRCAWPTIMTTLSLLASCRSSEPGKESAAAPPGAEAAAAKPTSAEETPVEAPPSGAAAEQKPAAAEPAPAEPAAAKPPGKEPPAAKGPAADESTVTGLKGHYGFDWMKPEKAKCTEIRDSLLAKLEKAGGCKARDGKEAFAEMAGPWNSCTLGKAEWLIYPTQEACKEQLETMMANAP